MFLDVFFTSIASALLFRRSRRSPCLIPPSESQLSEMAEGEEKPPVHWWLDRDGSINKKRSSWLQTEIAKLNEKTKAMLELIEADADSFSQRADLYFEKRLDLITLLEDLYRSYRTLAVRFDHLKMKTQYTLSSPFISDDSEEEFPRIQPIQESISYKNYQFLQETHDTESTKVASFYRKEEKDDQSLKLKEELERVREETESHEKELIYNEKQNREVIKQLDFTIQLINEEEEEEEENDEFLKLGDELERVKEENKTQKEESMYKEKQNRELTLSNQSLKEEENDELKKLKEAIDNLLKENESQKEELMQKEEESKDLNMEIQKLKEEANEESMKLREEIERVKEENENQKEKLMLKDEEKMEVIRQLSMAMDLLREEKMNLGMKVAAIKGVDMQRQERLLCTRLFG